LLKNTSNPKINKDSIPYLKKIDAISKSYLIDREREGY